MQSVVLAVKNAKSAKIRKKSYIIRVVFDLKAVHQWVRRALACLKTIIDESKANPRHSLRLLRPLRLKKKSN